MLHQHLSPKGQTMAAVVIEMARRENRDHLTDNQRLRMQAMRMDNVDIDTIAKIFGVSRSCAYITTKGYAPSKQVKEPSERFKQQLLDHRPWMGRLAASITRNREQAEDLAQETFLRAMMNEHQFETDTNLGAWLTTMMRNLHMNQARKRREVEDPDGVLASYRLSCPPEQNYNLILERLSEALNRLPPAQAEAIRLVCIQGMKYDDVGDLLDCSTGTIKSRVSRGREALAKLLGIDGSDLATDGVLAASLESRYG